MIIIIVFLNSFLVNSMENYKESLFELKSGLPNQGKICQYQSVRSPITCLLLCLENIKCKEITLIKENGEILCSKEYALCNHTNKYHFIRKDLIKHSTRSEGISTELTEKITPKPIERTTENITSATTVKLNTTNNNETKMSPPQRNIMTNEKTNIKTTIKMDTSKKTPGKTTEMSTKKPPEMILSEVIIRNFTIID